MNDLDVKTAADTDAVVREWRTLQDVWAATDDYLTLTRAARRMGQLVSHPSIVDGLTPVRLALLSDATTALIAPLLAAALQARGLNPALHTAPFGQIETALLDPAGPLRAFAPQVVVVLRTGQNLPGAPRHDQTPAAANAAAADACRQLLEPCRIFHEATGAEFVLNTFHAPPARPLGHLGARLAGDPVSFIRRLNVALGEAAPPFVHLVDVALLAERRGIDQWFDRRRWYEARQPMALGAVGEYCRHVAAVTSALLGRTRKCLVLDLDNTLWGGVVGDDGIAALEVGPGTPAGEAYADFQAYLAELKARGVLLAVSSKNDERIARQVFTEHPGMRLALDDFVAFEANWGPKSASIRTMAARLALPLDAFVFVDDNPAERAEVGAALPEVAVVPLPDDPGSYVTALESGLLFEVTRVSAEDLGRTAAYQARQAAEEARGSASDLGTFLASLDMRASVGPFDEPSLERITQLVNKTNQFNLTTPRMVQADLRRLMSDPQAVTCAVRLRDRYADHGLIGVTFGRFDGDELVIEAWLMSCRVLGRGVEGVVFNYLLDQARRRHARTIRGSYRPTDRNALVRDHYPGLGFEPLGRTGPAEEWTLSVAVAHPVDTFIAVEQDTHP